MITVFIITIFKFPNILVLALYIFIERKFRLRLKLPKIINASIRKTLIKILNY